MTEIVVAIPLSEHLKRAEHGEARLQILVNIRAVVLDVEVARHRANEWLREKIGNSLSATKPELVVNETLFWRFEVILGLPNSVQPGSGALYRVGQILIDAETGAIQDPDALASELQSSCETIEGSQ